MYLPLRHNCDDKIEIWWENKIKTLKKLEHNRSEIVLWKRNERKCYVIDISVGLDVTISKNHEAKIDIYLPLLAELKRLYPEYAFDVVPIVIGATGYIDHNFQVDL